VIAVLFGAFVILAISAGVLLLVALPHIRRGSRILTPQGERKVKVVKQRSGRWMTAVPAWIARLVRGSAASRSARRSRRLPPSLGGHGPLVVRPDDTGGLTITRDATGPIPLPDGETHAARHVSGGVAYPAPAPGKRILKESLALPDPEPSPVEPEPVAIAEPEPESVVTTETVPPPVPFTITDPEPALPAFLKPEPELPPAAEPEPEPEPAAITQPEPQPELKSEPAPDPVEPEPAAITEPEPEPEPEPEREPEPEPVAKVEPLGKPPVKPVKGGSKPRSKSTRGAPRGHSGGRGARRHHPAQESRQVDVRDDDPASGSAGQTSKRASSQ
jgi:hypothetical protein